MWNAVVLPILNPRIVLPEPSVKELVAAATVVIVGLAPPVDGQSIAVWCEREARYADK